MSITIFSDYIKGLAIMDDKLLQQNGHDKVFNKVSVFKFT